jgi:hypothetical protein
MKVTKSFSKTHERLQKQLRNAIKSQQVASVREAINQGALVDVESDDKNAVMLLLGNNFLSKKQRLSLLKFINEKQPGHLAKALKATGKKCGNSALTLAAHRGLSADEFSFLLGIKDKAKQSILRVNYRDANGLTALDLTIKFHNKHEQVKSVLLQAGASQPQPSRSYTEFCKYKLDGYCENGSDCAFAHGAGQLRCTFCKNVGHTISECASPNIKCWECGRQGHHGSACYDFILRRWKVHVTGPVRFRRDPRIPASWFYSGPCQSRDPPPLPRAGASQRSSPVLPRKLPRISSNFKNFQNFKQWESPKHCSSSEPPSSPASMLEESSDEPPSYAMACNSDHVHADDDDDDDDVGRHQVCIQGADVGAPEYFGSPSIWDVLSPQVVAPSPAGSISSDGSSFSAGSISSDGSSLSSPGGHGSGGSVFDFDWVLDEGASQPRSLDHVGPLAVSDGGPVAIQAEDANGLKTLKSYLEEHRLDRYLKSLVEVGCEIVEDLIELAKHDDIINALVDDIKGGPIKRLHKKKLLRLCAELAADHQ